VIFPLRPVRLCVASPSCAGAKPPLLDGLTSSHFSPTAISLFSSLVFFLLDFGLPCLFRGLQTFRLFLFRARFFPPSVHNDPSQKRVAFQITFFIILSFPILLCSKGQMVKVRGLTSPKVSPPLRGMCRYASRFGGKLYVFPLPILSRKFFSLPSPDVWFARAFPISERCIFKVPPFGSSLATPNPFVSSVQCGLFSAFSRSAQRREIICQIPVLEPPAYPSFDVTALSVLFRCKAPLWTTFPPTWVKAVFLPACYEQAFLSPHLTPCRIIFAPAFRFPLA